MTSINDFTLEEKVGLLSGKNTWETLDFSERNLNSIKFADVSSGLRVLVEDNGFAYQGEILKATCYPALSSLACSFDRELFYEVGKALGNEAYKLGISILLSPSLNIKRHPLGGRNSQYMSEDPFLNGELGLNYVQGIQSVGVGACVKHFALSNQETCKYTYNALVDERALREIYLEPFRKVIEKANPFALMSSHNKVNGEYCSENKVLLNKILREEWQYDGLVVSDWGATNDRIKALKQGLDLEMPTSSSYNDYKVLQAVQNKELDEKFVDDSVRRLFVTISKLDHPNPENYSLLDFNNIAEKAARESFVLLKNNNNFLPLDKEDSFMVVGKLADKFVYQNSGLSKIDASNEVSPLFAFNKEFGEIRYFACYDDDEISDASNLRKAIEMAERVKNVIIFVGNNQKDLCVELDKESFSLPKKQLEVIEALAKVNKNIVIVLEGNYALDYSFDDKAQAILHTGLMGQMGGKVVVDMLFGKVSPCGKLTETIPLKISDIGYDNYFAKEYDNVYYGESLYVGYRYFDTYKIPVKYPFGYGLNYGRTIIKCDRVIAKDDDLVVNCNVTNMSKHAIKEVIQVYLRNKSKRDYYAYQELKGFEKVSLQPFESKNIVITIPINEINYYDVLKGRFEVESGDYEVAIGVSSRDIAKVYPIRIKGSNDAKSTRNESSCYYKKIAFNEEDFRKLLGLRVLPPLNEKSRSYSLNSTLGDVKDSVAGLAVYKLVKQGINKEMMAMDEDSITKMLNYLPLRILAIASLDRFNFDQAQGLVDVLNNKLIRGVKGLKKTERIILNGKK